MELERDFAAWLEHRDSDALARVFDATGGKLLLLAAHLAGSGATAQDAVQATLVAAMARGTTWDRARPLWPWLAAILHNEVSMQLRRQRRRREVDLDAADGTAAPSEDPPSLAASHEVLGAVLHAIDEMPLPYRQVLRLRLVHGLRPVEIARSLEVPVGTVRAQLHRGLEQLRGVLPAGVAGLVGALFVGDGALLAQVRQRVLEGAMTTGTAAAPASTSWWVAGGWLSVNGKTIGLVVAGCALLACLGLWLGAPDWFAQRPRPEAPATLLRAELPADEPTPQGARSDAQPRRLVEAIVAPTWPLVVTVRTKDGAPIPDATVKAWLAPTCLQIENQEHGVFGREDVAVGTTGADGVFRATLDALRQRSALFRRTNLLWIRASWRHGRPCDVRLGLPRTMGPTSLTAEIELARRTVLVGRVADAAGAAVVGARVRLLSPESSPDNDHGDARSDDLGAFCLEPDDEPTNWPTQVAVLDARHGIANVAVPPPEATNARDTVDLGTIVLVTNDTVRGRVVLGDGSALAHVPVYLAAIEPRLADDSPGLIASLLQSSERAKSWVLRGTRLLANRVQSRTEPDGSFQFASLDPTATYVVYVRAVISRYTTAVVCAGGELVTLRVEAQLLTIEPRDERGEIVPGVSLLAEGYDPDSPWPSYKKRAGFPETGLAVSNLPFAADPAGRLMLLSPFGWIWRIGTSDEITQPTSLRHDVLPGAYRATRVLELHAETRFGKLHLVVVDEKGEPLNHGATLQALDRDLQRNDSRTVPPASGMTWELPAGPWRLHVLLGKEVVYEPMLDAYVRGFHEQLVTIEDGRTVEVRVEARPAGMVAFRLHSAQPPAGPWKNLRIEEAGRDVACVLAREESDPRPRAPGQRPATFLTRQALAPGRHTFVVMADGWQPATCNVDVVADKLTTVGVEMFPQ